MQPGGPSPLVYEPEAEARPPDGRWGLAEVYVNGRVFRDEDVAAAQPLAHAFGEALERLPAPAFRS